MEECPFQQNLTHNLTDYICISLIHNRCLTVNFPIFKLTLIFMSFLTRGKILVESVLKMVDSHCDQTQMLPGIVGSFVIHDHSWWGLGGSGKGVRTGGAE